MTSPAPFDWDEANTGHIAGHAVTRSEAEEAITDPRAFVIGARLVSGEFRTTVVGATTAGRILTVVFIVREGRIRVVTAYRAPRRYVRQYQRGGTP